jgi:hypothetical protein
MKTILMRIGLVVALAMGLCVVVASTPQNSEAQRSIPTALVLDPSIFKAAPTVRAIVPSAPRAIAPTVPAVPKVVATPRVINPADLKLNPAIMGMICPNCVSYGGKVRGEIATAGAQVKHSFIGTAGDLVNVSVERAESSTKLDPVVELRDPDGKVVASNVNTAGNTVNSLIRNFKLPKSGTYSITTHSKGTGAGTFWLTLWRSNSCGGPLTLSVNGSAESDEEISASAKSCAYTFQGKKGEQIDITMKAVDRTLNPSLVLLDPSGKHVKANDDEVPGNRDSRIIVTLEIDGTYKLVARASGDQSFGRYEVRLTPPPPPVFRIFPPPCGSDNMQFGQEIRKEVVPTRPSGACIYTVFATAGDIVTIRMMATSSTLNPLVKLMDESGSQEAIGSTDRGGGESSIANHRLLRSGRYDIRAGSVEDKSGGEFTVSVMLVLPTPTPTSTPTRTPTATATKPGPTPTSTLMPTATPSPTPEPPLTCGGEISYGQVVADRIPLVEMFCEHTFAGTAGDVVTLWLAAPNEAFDPLLELIPPAGGEPEASNDDANFPDNRNSMIDGHVLLQDGVYTIRARSYRDQGTGDYVLFLVKSQ